MKEFVINWFANNGAISKEELENDYTINYLEQGIIDSFAFLDLIAACEHEFGIKFRNDDFMNDDIFTISGLIDILNSY